MGTGKCTYENTHFKYSCYGYQIFRQGLKKEKKYDIVINIFLKK
jgi:hypothetical protein